MSVCISRSEVDAEKETDSAELDRRIVFATQAGLPLVSRPYDELADRLGVSSERLQQRLRAMLADGRIRRIAAVPNHYRLGYVANGMSVWDVDDRRVDALGERVGALDFVSHCYRRPRHPPDWPYNLFAMVHAHDRDEARDKVERIAALLGDACRAHEVLFSKRILKKTGMRLRPD
ncbi:MAG TPA: Lrp/AsnC family transcriptional regulator [Chromatiaceae bacterium]|nr:Lrp/AsnC family transcriptional regulator [Chromatiaceae bacterium]